MLASRLPYSIDNIRSITLELLFLRLCCLRNTIIIRTSPSLVGYGRKSEIVSFGESWLQKLYLFVVLRCGRLASFEHTLPVF